MLAESISRVRTVRPPPSGSTSTATLPSASRLASSSAMRASAQVGVSMPATASNRSSWAKPARAAALPASGAPISGAIPEMPIISTTQ